MLITPLEPGLIPAVEVLIGLGGPYVRVRTSSDYWLYASLFSTTCPVAMDENEVVGVVIAFRSQDNPDDVYLQDVVTRPDHRRRGIARRLIATIHRQAAVWECKRLYLTSEPDNTTAHGSWLALGFTNSPGDQTIDGISVISNYKGPTKHRAVYELPVSPAL
jgi:GNAT superfamily N-acetyltransferase